MFSLRMSPFAYKTRTYWLFHPLHIREHLYTFTQLSHSSFICNLKPNFSPIMSLLPLLLFILICLSLHACTARPFRAIEPENYRFDKDLNKVGSSETSSLWTSALMESQTQQQKVTNDKTNVAAESYKEAVGTSSGSSPTSFQTGLPSSLATKGHQRSMVGPVGERENESRSNDAVDMDYAQPHKKPPIHNEP